MPPNSKSNTFSSCLLAQAPSCQLPIPLPQQTWYYQRSSWAHRRIQPVKIYTTLAFNLWAAKESVTWIDTVQDVRVTVGSPQKHKAIDLRGKVVGVNVVVLVKLVQGKVSGQAAGARKVSGQVAGATNVFGQVVGARKVFG
nr:hypothetical protein [Tanacetum cinerariifolium]